MPKDDHPPAFLLYVDDFASDGKVEAMTTQQVGAYFLLLCKAWREDPPGSIPNDDRVLARWARLTPDEWSECRTGVLAAFSVGTDNRWHQRRMRKEYAKLIDKAKEKSKAAKRAAAARWSDRRCGPHYERNADALPEDANVNASSSSNSISASDVDVSSPGVDAHIEISEEEMPEVLEKCNRVLEVIPMAPDGNVQQNQRDRSLIFKAVVLSRTRMSQDWLEDSLEAVRKSNGKAKKKISYFHGVLQSKCQAKGQNFNQLLKQVVVPESVLRPKSGDRR